MQQARLFRPSRLVAVIAASVLMVGVSSSVAFAGDTPAGFFYGTDTNGPTPKGITPPIANPPGCSGTYGFYAGRIDTTSDPDFDGFAALAAGADQPSGVGDETYYDLEGPQSDPNYNASGTEAQKEAEAYTWGQDQGAIAITNWTDIYNDGINGYEPVPSAYPIIFADVETGDSGYGTTPDLAVDRSVFNGFHDEIAGATVTLSKVSQLTLWAGVYSAPSNWTGLMQGNLTPSSGTYQWTWEDFNASTSDGCPSGWSISGGNSASPFASYATGSNCFIAWQFVGGTEDWDQVDASRIASDYTASTCN